MDNSDEESPSTSVKEEVKDVQGTSEQTPRQTFSKSSTFTVAVSGTIDKVYFARHNHVYCKFCFSYGTDWTVISGVEEGVTQIGQRSHLLQDLESSVANDGPFITWNHPLEVTFLSSNPFGWPQLVVSVYGLDVFGNDIIRGYGSVHIPPIAGSNHRLKIPLFVPDSSTMIGQFKAWLTGSRPEFVDAKVAAHGEGRGVLTTSSTGYLDVNINCLISDFSRHGFRT